MLICRSNYESFLIDYLDNTLTAEVRDEVDAFLLVNPDIAAEFEGLQDIHTKPSKNIFQNKDLLKKSDYNELGIYTESDYLCIAELEKDITPNEQIRLNHLSSTNPEVERLRNIYTRTKLKTKVTFANKAQLKHRSIGNYVLPFIRIAAVIAIVVSLFVWQRYSNTNQIADVQVATNSNINTLGNKTYNIADDKAHIISYSNLAENTGSNSSAPVENKKIYEYKDIKDVNRINTLNYTNNQNELKAIKAIATQTIPISNSIESIRINHLPSKSETVKATLTTQLAEQTISHTTEYTIKSLAIKGAQRLSNMLGLKSDIQYNKDGKITRWKIEGNFIAFSSTNKKYENID